MSRMEAQPAAKWYLEISYLEDDKITERYQIEGPFENRIAAEWVRDEIKDENPLAIIRLFMS